MLRIYRAFQAIDLGQAPQIGRYGDRKGSCRVTGRIDKTLVIWVEFNRYDLGVDPAQDKNSSGGVLEEEGICPAFEQST